MLAAARGLNGCLTVDDLAELVAFVSLECNHHENELGPGDDSIAVLVVLFEHVLCICICGLSVTEIDHNVFELATIHSAISVLIVVLEGLCQLSLLLST